jgi:hypothetical protein
VRYHGLLGPCASERGRARLNPPPTVVLGRYPPEICHNRRVSDLGPLLPTIRRRGRADACLVTART